MHMADALLSPTVGIALDVISVGAIAYSVAKVKKEDSLEKKVALMGISGALVFAGQMINFSIPGTGSSGHIGGGILLAGLLGGVAAFLSIAAVLIIQCLFFADGGLLALGCNIFNMGIIPCLIIYPLLFNPMLKNNITKSRLTKASIISVVAGLQLGAFCVVLQTFFSGITRLPFGAFLALMQPIHLAIGVIEGIVTAAILCFVYQARPEILENASFKNHVDKTFSVKKVAAALAVMAVVIGGALSIFASSNPDGLEWAIEKVAGTAELEANGAVYEKTKAVQNKTAFLPDYNFDGKDGVFGTTASGVAGAVITFLMAGTTGLVISKLKKVKKRTVTVDK